MPLARRCFQDHRRVVAGRDLLLFEWLGWPAWNAERLARFIGVSADYVTASATNHYYASSYSSGSQLVFRAEPTAYGCWWAIDESTVFEDFEDGFDI